MHRTCPLAPLARPVALAALLACASLPALAADTTRVIVGYKAGAGAPVSAAVDSARGKVHRHLQGMDAMAVDVPTAELARLQKRADVLYVEEDVKRYPLAGATASGAPYQSGQLVPWGNQAVQAHQLPDTYAANRKICIIDSGYALGHEDLPGSASVSGEYDSGTGAWSTDENHHGTHVAGTIAAMDAAGTGVVGVLPGSRVKLHIVKVFDAAGWAYSSTLVAAAYKCRDAGANIISMSLGGSTQNRTELNAFATLLSTNNILSIAAAGNAGTTRVSYPAGYASVVSVAAVDESLAWASFSQYNKDVELAGPGVNVLSTLPMGAGSSSALTVNGAAYAAGGMDGSPKLTATGALADFGLGGTATAGSMSGKVCLIQRGTYDFATKVANCQASGGVGAVVYNNVAGSFGGTLGTTVTAIPSVTASDTDGTALKALLGSAATVSVTASHYAYYDGTSMATPHVSAVAALVWSYFPSCTAAQLRTSLTLSAKDLGTTGRDNKYGYGLVQAKAAYDRIASKGCGK